MKIAFVTGGTGFIGANVIRELLKKGRRVRTLVRHSSDRSNLKGLDVEVFEGDILDEASLPRAMQKCDEVFHVAAEYAFWSENPAKYYETNVTGTKNVLEAARRCEVPRIVYTSTVGTIGLPKDASAVASENSAVEPEQLRVNHYKKSKFEAENVAKEFAKSGLPIVIVNPSAPVGQWDRKPTPTGQVIVDFVNGRIPAYVETGLNLVSAKDVAAGHVLAAEKGRVGERYILGNENLSLSEILNRLSKITGKPAPSIRLPYGLAWFAGFVSTAYADYVTHRPPRIALEGVKMAKKFMYFDSSKAINELGLPQTPVDQALSEAIEWFKERKYFHN